MPLVNITDLSIQFRGPALLDGVHCIIERGQRIGLLGRNGAGKTTFLNLLAGALEPDSGSIDCDGRIAILPQEVPQDIAGPVAAIVRKGITMPALVDETNEWEIDHKVDQILTRMSLDPDAAFEKMSSGMKRRVLLARALVDGPDLLLLDEPTNHLDIDAIQWLEEFLARWQGAYVFITHDRQFLRRLATRILEIERGKLFDWTCDYDTFLQRKQDALAAEEKQNALFDKKLAEEEVWIRQGIKARRTRNEGRVRALKQLRLERSERREKIGTSNLQIQTGVRSGNLVATLDSVSFQHGSGESAVPIVDHYSTTIMRGDKVGIIGPNGAGKTTVLKLLLGKLEPTSGTVRLGTNLQIAYFDQLRDQLDPEKTVEENVGDGYKTIDFNGNPRHVLGYLQDFLFTPERARTPVKRLSGGERNRILLAKLFAKPANVIVLDEPTNDLDAETLEMLEERLVDYEGTLLIVSHDREFLNNVVTNCIVFETDSEGEKTLSDYVGGYDDWKRQSQAQALEREAARQTKARDESSSGNASTSAASKNPARKLNFKESKELEKLPGTIEKLESEIAAQHVVMADPNFYKQAGEVIAKQQGILKDLESQLATAFARWEELDS